MRPTSAWNATATRGGSPRFRRDVGHIERIWKFGIQPSMKKLLVIVSAAVLLVGCFSRNVKLTVVNGSAATLTNIVATGSGFSIPLGVLTPGATQQVSLTSDKGEFKLEFDANGKHFSEASPKDPWNGFKEIITTVTTNFSVTYESVTTF